MYVYIYIQYIYIYIYIDHFNIWSNHGDLGIPWLKKLPELSSQVQGIDAAGRLSWLADDRMGLEWVPFQREDRRFKHHTLVIWFGLTILKWLQGRTAEDLKKKEMWWRSVSLILKVPCNTNTTLPQKHMPWFPGPHKELPISWLAGQGHPRI